MDNLKHGTESMSSLFDLVSTVNFNVVIRGLPNEDLPAASALLFPFVRRSSRIREAAQHLDTISCWKGLSSSQSDELSVWERLFKESMALQIKELLQRDFASRLERCTDAKNEMLLISRMANFLAHEQSSMINLSMSRLVHDMISLLYSETCSETTTRRTMEWSLSSQDLPSLVYNLVRLHDCFIHTLNGPKVLFDVSQSYTRGVLTAFVNVRWQPPRVIFPDLPSRLFEGDPYRITPRFASIDLFADDNSEFHWLKDETTYTVTKSSLPLLWNDAEHCFYVPDNQEETKDGVHETILSARITTHFQGGVRFETQSRYSINLQVYGDKYAEASYENRDGIGHALGAFQLREGRPACHDPGPKHLFPFHQLKSSAHKSSGQLSWLPSITINPISTTRQCTSRNAPSNGTVHRVRKDSVTRSLCNLPTPAVIESNAGSPGKRKASSTDELALYASEPLASEEVQRPCAEVDAKRRKLELADSEVFSTEAATDRGKTPDSGSVTSSPKRSAGASTKPRLSIPSTLSSGASSSTINNDSPPVTASATSSTSPPMLTQEQIQRNYREFEEQQQRKAAERAYYAATIPGFDGVVSPTDVNDKSIERIFIERMDNDDEAED